MTCRVAVSTGYVVQRRSQEFDLGGYIYRYTPPSLRPWCCTDADVDDDDADRDAVMVIPHCAVTNYIHVYVRTAGLPRCLNVPSSLSLCGSELSSLQSVTLDVYSDVKTLLCFQLPSDLKNLLFFHSFSQKFGAVFVWFQGFTERELSASSLLCCRISTLVLMGSTVSLCSYDPL